MGFNYLQTDDRDDYFAQFNKKPKRKPESFSLISPDGEMVLQNVPSFKIRSFAKKTFIQPAKHIWRQLLQDAGYKVINNYADAAS